MMRRGLRGIGIAAGKGMHQDKIEAAALTCEWAEGFPPALDAVADAAAPACRFVRAAWFAAAAAGAPDRARTLVLRRGAGEAIAALPTVPHPRAAWALRQVPGSYWPFRAAAIAAGTDPAELAHALAAPEARALGPSWRLGPARADDPGTQTLIAAARMAGWRVCERAAGTVWLIDLDAARAANWPSARTKRRLRTSLEGLESQGPVHWQHVRGQSWSEAVLEQLARIEAESWIAGTTDGSGAKFLRPHQRALWRGVLADPVLAEMLSATILMVGTRPVAFSFDLVDGAWQYSIAGSYAEDLARFGVGKLVNHRVVTDAMALGLSVVDMGSGDGGYKREMGAAAGYELVDLLFVRNRMLGALADRGWQRGAAE